MIVAKQHVLGLTPWWKSLRIHGHFNKKGYIALWKSSETKLRPPQEFPIPHGCPIDMHAFASRVFAGIVEFARGKSGIAGSWFRSKMHICISQWIECNSRCKRGKHASSLGWFGSPQKCKSDMTWGMNWVRKRFASWIGWISSTTSKPPGSIRGNQKKNVWAMWRERCDPSSTTILRGGAPGRCILFLHMLSRKDKSDASPQCSLSSSKYFW